MRESNYLSLVVFVCHFFLSSILLNAQEEIQAPPSNWVDIVNVNSDSSIIDGPTSYVLSSTQINTLNHETYHRVILRLNTADGIQENSTISVDYDPKYQKLIFHEVNVNRKSVDQKRSISNLQKIRRESDLSRYLYDGRISAVLEVKDVRVGDVLEYSYTIVGVNPLLKDEISIYSNLNFSVPLQRIYNTIISKDEVNYKLFQNAPEPNIHKGANRYKYVWNVESVEAVSEDYSTPIWYNDYQRIESSSYENWDEVRDWALPLYSVSNKELAQLRKELFAEMQLDNSEKSILKAIRFVQDEIRYLGFEDGINAFKPHPATQILNQRFGDCKDKSLLLSSILNLMDVDASPLLVNTYNGFKLNESLPSPLAFNHCIVTFRFNNQNYFVDPTSSHEGGDLEHLVWPSYEKGLVINENEKGLADIPQNIPFITKIEETIVIDSVGAPSRYFVKSEYQGKPANLERSQFMAYSINDLKENYEAYYANVYPSIKSVDISKDDRDRNGANKFMTSEEYLINDFWVENSAGVGLIASIYPYMIYNLTNYNIDSGLEKPLNIGEPVEIYHKIKIALPEFWSVEEKSNKVNNKYFDFSSNLRYDRDTIYLDYRYYQKKSYVETEDVKAILKDFDIVQNEISFQLSHPGVATSQVGINYFLFATVFLGVVIGIILCYWLFFKYDPIPAFSTMPYKIDGWLILPAIGLSLTPFILLFGVFSLYGEEGYNIGTWSALWSNQVENGRWLLFIIVMEVLFNVIFFFYSIVLVILFFKRRSSIPVLAVVFYTIGFIVPFVDGILVMTLNLETEPNQLFTRDLIKSFLSMLIWAPYFALSDKVKRTFTCQRVQSISDIEDDIIQVN